MPRFPRSSAQAEAIRASTFEAFASKLRRRSQDPDFVPLHLGDTYPLPPEASRRVPLDDPALHRYGPVTGEAALREAGARDLASLGLQVEPEAVFVTPGATGGLDLGLNATLEPGDEVLVLTPTWPLILGLLQRRGCVPVQVDVDPSGWLPAEVDLFRSRLEAALSDRTAGISLCNPNNPAGFLYGPDHLRAVLEVARAHDLWIYYDAVYADMVYGAEQPLTFAGGDAAERTLVVTSYSKTFGLAGHRVGLLVAPPAVRHLIPRLQTHSTYHTARLAQAMVLAALNEEAEQARGLRREIARRGAALVAEHLGDALCHAPQGGAFVLLDLRERVADEAGTLALLDRCLDAGVSLAPGSAFGERFGRFARVCFTATEPERVAEGLKRLKTIL